MNPYKTSTLKQHTMTVTYQANVLDTSYNGWENYETRNVALWINNDAGLYNAAKSCTNYQELVSLLYDCGSTETPDGVKWTDAKIDGLAVNEMMKDL
jgi:hypothetical protein